MIRIEITAASRIGCATHQNEDMILVDSHFIRNDDYKTLVTLNHDDRFVVAVADGITVAMLPVAIP